MKDLAIGEIATTELDGEEITYTAELAENGCHGCLFVARVDDSGNRYVSAAARTACKTHACAWAERDDEQSVIFVCTTPKPEQPTSNQTPTLLEVVRRMIAGETSDTIGYHIQYDLGCEPLVFTRWAMVSRVYATPIMEHAISGKTDSDWKVVPAKKTSFYFIYQLTPDSEPIFFHGTLDACTTKHTEVVMANSVILKDITKLK